MESDIIAGVFGKIFNILAENPEMNRVMSEQLWELAKNYHFDLFLMGCDASLIKLGLGVRDVEGFMKYRD
jgi:hypothetical protein